MADFGIGLHDSAMEGGAHAWRTQRHGDDRGQEPGSGEEVTLQLKRSEHGNGDVQTYQSGDAEVVVYASQFAGTNRATSVTWTVDDVDDTVKDLKARGVAFEHYDLPDTTRKGDVHLSGNMKMAWFKDPDGNILSVVSGEM